MVWICHQAILFLFSTGTQRLYLQQTFDAIPVIDSKPTGSSRHKPACLLRCSCVNCSFPAAGDPLPKQLAHLLAFLSKLEHEKGLKLGNNPWSEPPEAVVNKGVNTVLDYFGDLFAEDTPVRRNMLKVVIVGHAGAGKTR